MDFRPLLAQADFAPLLMSYVHLSGDTQALETYRPYIKGPWAFHEEVPAPLKAALLDKFNQFLWARERGQRDASLPDEALLHRMMNTCVGQTVPDEYLPLIHHEMRLGQTPALEVHWRQRPSEQVLQNFKVLIIGAGESGIGTGVKLQELGIPFEIIERNASVGGTWLENSYPGCGVDTPNHFYQYSFAPNHGWSRYFSPRDEIWKYLEDCADRFDIRRHVRFHTEVTAAQWMEAKKLWQVQVRGPDGVVSVLQAQVLVSAVGQLNIPAIPDLPGLDDFQGAKFHTARWDHGAPLKGQRVGMVGTGASGMQVGPSIVDDVAQLTIFQRSPHWAIKNALYFSEVSEGKKWALKNLPHYAQWYRFQLFWASADGLYPHLKVDPNWAQPDLSLNAANHEIRQNLIAHITHEVGGDPELIRKAVPMFPPYGKRMLRDNHWYRMLTNPKVNLVTDGIERVLPHGVRTRDGQEHTLDTLVLATGFQAGRITWPMHIEGRQGSLRERWGDDDPRAYMGLTVPSFPNFFVMFGPNTTLAHGGSAIFFSECQARYLLLALRDMLEGGYTSLDCKPEVHDAFNQRVDDIHSQMVWSHKGVGSWYKNKKGRVFATSPWRMVDYWEMTRVFDRDDYTVT